MRVQQEHAMRLYVLCVTSKFNILFLSLFLSLSLCLSLSFSLSLSVSLSCYLFLFLALQVYNLSSQIQENDLQHLHVSIVCFLFVL